MNVFTHHIYEFQKGLRHLIMHTLDCRHRVSVENKLRRLSIPYVIRDISAIRFNVFFGDQNCIAVLEKIGNKPLSEFSDTEDFMLGAMLGYGITQQCRRFVERHEKKKKTAPEKPLKIARAV